MVCQGWNVQRPRYATHTYIHRPAKMVKTERIREVCLEVPIDIYVGGRSNKIQRAVRCGPQARILAILEANASYSATPVVHARSDVTEALRAPTVDPANWVRYLLFPPSKPQDWVLQSFSAVYLVFTSPCSVSYHGANPESAKTKGPHLGRIVSISINQPLVARSLVVIDGGLQHRSHAASCQLPHARAICWPRPF